MFEQGDWSSGLAAATLRGRLVDEGGGRRQGTGGPLPPATEDQPPPLPRFGGWSARGCVS